MPVTTTAQDVVPGTLEETPSGGPVTGAEPPVGVDLVEADLVEADLVEADLLVEDVSIDGMCGVY